MNIRIQSVEDALTIRDSLFLEARNTSKEDVRDNCYRIAAALTKEIDAYEL